MRKVIDFILLKWLIKDTVIRYFVVLTFIIIVGYIIHNGFDAVVLGAVIAELTLFIGDKTWEKMKK